LNRCGGSGLRMIGPRACIAVGDAKTFGAGLARAVTIASFVSPIHAARSWGGESPLRVARRKASRSLSLGAPRERRSERDRKAACRMGGEGCVAERSESVSASGAKCSGGRVWPCRAERAERRSARVQSRANPECRDDKIGICSVERTLWGEAIGDRESRMIVLRRGDLSNVSGVRPSAFDASYSDELYIRQCS
jgi:hypothetical protein